jgi:hypothetical protein
MHAKENNMKHNDIGEVTSVLPLDIYSITYKWDIKPLVWYYWNGTAMIQYRVKLIKYYRCCMHMWYFTWIVCLVATKPYNIIRQCY